MTIIAFKDIYRDNAAGSIATAAREHDAEHLIGAGDDATMRERLAPPKATATRLGRQRAGLVRHPRLDPAHPTRPRALRPHPRVMGHDQHDGKTKA